MLDALVIVLLIFILLLFYSKIIGETVFVESFFPLTFVYLPLAVLILYRRRKQTSKPAI